MSLFAIDKHKNYWADFKNSFSFSSYIMVTIGYIYYKKNLGIPTNTSIM